MGDQHQVHVWENTYIMQPKAPGSGEPLEVTSHKGRASASQDNEKMLPSKVTAVIKNVMEGYLQAGVASRCWPIFRLILLVGFLTKAWLMLVD